MNVKAASEKDLLNCEEEKKLEDEKTATHSLRQQISYH